MLCISFYILYNSQYTSLYVLDWLQKEFPIQTSNLDGVGTI